MGGRFPSAHFFKNEDGPQRFMKHPEIDAIIFDMDGVLIDSEPLWRIAESIAFNAVGVPMREEDGFLTMGLRTDEVVEFWYARHPWNGTSKKEVEADIVRQIIHLIEERGEAIEGAVETVLAAQEAGYRVGLASSSSSEIITAVLDRLSLAAAFDVTHSAEHEAYGKPHPAVYIECARRLEVDPARCLAFEDSPAGLLAAKSAKMRCIAIPAPELSSDGRYCIADLTISSLPGSDLQNLITKVMD
jgi:mannitol-1-/sugar-/sorbitol-6-/2-deoxyglucose-6-phosphatase